MDITPLVAADRSLIKSYGDGGITIRGQRWEGSILVLPDRVLPWSVTHMDHFTPESLALLLEAQPLPEFVVLGCGPDLVPLSPIMRGALRAQGLVVEPMGTGAACRTWNVVLTEGRNAAAALIAV